MMLECDEAVERNVGIEVREATQDDAGDLMALQARCPQGSSLVVSIVNTPDFYVRTKAHDEWRVLVATEGGQIVGSAACAIRRLLISGKERKVGYEFQYFTVPEARGKGVARALRNRIEKYLVENEVALSYALIIEGNLPSVRLFERQGFFKHRTLDYSILMPFKPMPVEGRVRRIQPSEYSIVARLCESAWGGSDFHEVMTSERVAELVERLPGFCAGDLWGLEEAGEIVACVGIWDWSGLTRVTVERLSVRLQATKLAVDFLRRFRPMPGIPRMGEVLREQELVFVGFEDPRHLTPLFYHANNEALRKGIHETAIVCDREHPLLRSTKGLFRTSFGFHLYVKPFQPLSLINPRVHVEA